MKCNCGKEAVIYLYYSGEYLCEKHFKQLIERRFVKAINTFKMIKHGEHIAVGYSGGKDSNALLYLLKKLQKKRNIHITAISIVEGIKDYRDKEHINLLKQLPKQLGIKHIVKTYEEVLGVSLQDVAHKVDNICKYCAVFKRDILNDVALEIGANKIALGHNLDDIVGTLFLNLIRYEPQRLKRYFEAEEREGFVKRIKPLMYIPEKEIKLYTILNNIDSTFGECPFAHKAMRYYLRKMINDLEDKSPGTKFKLLKSFLSLSKDIKQERVNLKKCKICGKPTNNEICMSCKMKMELGLNV